WSICNAHVAIDATFARVVGGDIEHYHASRTFKRTYRASLQDWQVEDEPGQLAIDVTQWPQDPEALHDLGISLERDLLQIPSIDVRIQGGELARVVKADELSRQLSKTTQALFLEH